MLNFDILFYLILLNTFSACNILSIAIREPVTKAFHQNQNQNQTSFICQVCLHIQEIALVSLVH